MVFQLIFAQFIISETKVLFDRHPRSSYTLPPNEILDYISKLINYDKILSYQIFIITISPNDHGVQKCNK